jgi:membrane protease YdiL (CAAX protease family)
MPEGLPPPIAVAPPAAPPRPGPRPRTGIAWAVILGVTGLVAVLQAFPRTDPEEAEAVALRFLEQQVQVQYGIQGIAASVLGGDTGPTAYRGLREAMGRGPVSQRQRFAVVAGDMVGPAEARAFLEESGRVYAARGRPPQGRRSEVERVLRSLYEGAGVVHTREAVERLPAADRALLRGELGWFGDLALAPAGSPDRDGVLEPARRKARTTLAVLGAGVACLGVGVLLGILHVAFLLRGGVRLRLAPGAVPAGIHAETFAAWLVLFLGLSVGIQFLARAYAPPGWGLPLAALGFALSLSALAWPVLRGVPWAQVRADAGLVLSATPVRDVLAGIGCWFMALPLMAAALLATVALAALSRAGAAPEDPLAPTSFPTHPVAGEIAQGVPWFWIVLLASGLAPLVEETFFRGLLYRSLRDPTARMGRAGSVAIAALLSGLLFAAVHPQGLLAVPLLAAVAWPMVHAREWRGSLLAPMAVHAWHNGLATLAGFLLLGK